MDKLIKEIESIFPIRYNKIECKGNLFTVYGYTLIDYKKINALIELNNDEPIAVVIGKSEKDDYLYKLTFAIKQPCQQ